MDIKFKFHFTRYILLFMLVFFMINGVVENIIIKTKINDFKSSTKLVYTDVENGIKYYCVSRETYESSLRQIDGKMYIGSKGDIIVRQSSPYPEIPVFHQLMTFFIGGHAAYVVDSKKTIEVNGKDSNNKVDYYNNDWFNQKECIGLRLKNKKIIDDVTKQVESKIGAKYNYSFVFDNGYYCTDLMSKSVAEVDKFHNINDFLFTTTNDIITSSNTEICYYHYTDTSNIKHVYYIN